VDKKVIIKNIYPVGACFVKNDRHKSIGNKNQKKLEFFFIAKIKQNKEIIENIAE
tara:strand:- start:664 stop:828 length:165 start_codon:yes stop_codon:yes gene_type:complete